MSMTIEIPDTLAEQIRTAAAAEGVKGQDINNYAIARLQEVFQPAEDEEDETEEPDADLIAALRRGIADRDAGRTVSIDQMKANAQAALAALPARAAAS